MRPSKIGDDSDVKPLTSGRRQPDNSQRHSQQNVGGKARKFTAEFGKTAPQFLAILTW